ncbi:MAG: elongation factor [Actinomycetota bacterium]|nr:elongation factor [Actinomycetota bacterium]MEA2446846.1 elongation factor [Actinomycetota bacterium]
MISTNDMRPGQTLEIDGTLFTILNYQHVKPGKGQAFVKTKLRNLKNGAVAERTFRADEKVNLAVLDKREMQFLYEEDAGLVFMDNESYEQIHVDAALLGDARRFLKDGTVVMVPVHDGTPVGAEMPLTIELEIVDTEPGHKGDRVSGALKPATLETGATIQVPLFLEKGERVKVDTRSGDYLSRA